MYFHGGVRFVAVAVARYSVVGRWHRSRLLLLDRSYSLDLAVAVVRNSLEVVSGTGRVRFKRKVNARARSTTDRENGPTVLAADEFF